MEYLYDCQVPWCDYAVWHDTTGPKSHIASIPEDDGEVLARQEEHFIPYHTAERGKKR